MRRVNSTRVVALALLVLAQVAIADGASTQSLTWTASGWQPWRQGLPCSEVIRFSLDQLRAVLLVGGPAPAGCAEFLAEQEAGPMLLEPAAWLRGKLGGQAPGRLRARPCDGHEGRTLEISLPPGDFELPLPTRMPCLQTQVTTAAAPGIPAGATARAITRLRDGAYGLGQLTPEPGAVILVSGSHSGPVRLFQSLIGEHATAFAVRGGARLVPTREGTMAGGEVEWSGLPGGDYLLEVESGEGIREVLGPVTVASGEVYEFVDVSAPQASSVVVDVAHLGGGEIHLMATPLVDGAEGSYSREARGKGPSLEVELSAGSWRIQLTALRGGRPSCKLASEDVTLLPGESRILAPETRAFRRAGIIAGAAHLEGLPLRFQAHRFVPGLVNQTPLEAEGTFEYCFPAEGTYSLFLGGGPDILIPVVDVEAGDDPLELELPKGVISGRVVGDAGEPLAEAGVQMIHAHWSDDGETFVGQLFRRIATDQDGAFLLAGLPAGTYQLSAHTRARMSAAVDVELGGGRSRADLELTAVEATPLPGQLLLPPGQELSPRTQILARFSQPEGPVLAPAVAFPDADGKFELQWPPAAVRASIQVDGPGLPTTAFAVHAGATSIRLPLASGGYVRGTSDGREVLAADWSSYLFLRPDGAFASILDNRRAVPYLAAGEWSIVPRSREALMRAWLGRPAAEFAEKVFLHSGEERAVAVRLDF